MPIAAARPPCPKAVGVGLSATIAILALAVAAMWVLNNQTVV